MGSAGQHRWLGAREAVSVVLLGVPGLGTGLAATVVYRVLALVACLPGGVVLFSIAVPVGAGY